MSVGRSDIKVLIFGIGNPGRRDDGLGPALLQEMRGADVSRGTDALASEGARSGADPRRDKGASTALEFRYQLNVEDAYTIRDFDLVIFADSSSGGGSGATGVGEDAGTRGPEHGAAGVTQDGANGVRKGGAAAEVVPEDVALNEIGPSATIAFTTHEMSPASVLGLCHELYGRTPRAFALAIRGYEWDLGEGLSEKGRANLARAADVLRRFLDEQ